MKTPLTRAWTPIHPPEHYEKTFTHIDANMVLEAFYSHHITKGTLSPNWEETFRGFCEYRNTRTANELARQGGHGTDSVGMALDPRKRHRAAEVPDYGIRFMEALQKYAHLPEAEAHARAVADLEGTP